MRVVCCNAAMFSLGQQRHKLLRLLVAKSTAEQMGKIVPKGALRSRAGRAG
jgi:hypothetical protein